MSILVGGYCVAVHASCRQISRRRDGGDFADHKTICTCRWFCYRGEVGANIEATMLVLDVRQLFWWVCEVADAFMICLESTILDVRARSAYDCREPPPAMHIAIAPRPTDSSRTQCSRIMFFTFERPYQTSSSLQFHTYAIQMPTTRATSHDKFEVEPCT